MHASARAASATTTERGGPSLWNGALLPLLLGVVAFASRLPYLRPGYGTDPDAYRVLGAARVVRAGEYTASRLPGFPLHELATALLLPGGPRLVNGATAVMSAGASVALFKLAEELGVSRLRATLLTLAFTFTPVVYVNSTTAMDYLWSLCFTLLAALQIVRGRPLWAGVLLGAAIGARLTAGAMLLPLLVLNRGVLGKGRALSGALRLTLGAALSATVCFVPVFYTYGTSFFSYDDGQTVPWPVVLSRAGPDVWGNLGIYAWCGVVAIALCDQLRSRGGEGRVSTTSFAIALRHPHTGWLLAACCTVQVVFGCVFLLLPHEAAYLIPCVPFALLLVAALLPTLAIFELACLLLVSSFVSLNADGLSLPGPVEGERLVRVAQNAAANGVIRLVASKPDKALIIAGPRLPLIEAKLGGSEQGPHRYLYLLQSEAELEHYLQQGYALYYVDGGVEWRQQQIFGINLREHGGRALFERARARGSR